MGIGSLISNFLNSLGLVLPPYIGTMFAASIMRNLADETKLFSIDLEVVSVIGNFTLTMFLSMILMNFKLWELKELALPLIIMLIGQTILMGVFAYFITFTLTGKDYDAAIMTGGHCGCGFGTTPKALANMEALTEKYLPSPKAFFVIPIVGALFIDFFNAAIITFFINLLK
jgi:ESS family glutamate:Na+ symporter